MLASTLLSPLMHVLVVDDTLGVLKLTEMILSSHGHQVTCASSGKDATEIVQAQEIDLVLMDVLIGGMSGIETARMVRAVRPELPIVFMTGFSDQLESLCGETVLEKPFTSEKLIDPVETGYKKSMRRGIS